MGGYIQPEAGNLDAADHGASTPVQSVGLLGGRVGQHRPTNHGREVAPATFSAVTGQENESVNSLEYYIIRSFVNSEDCQDEDIKKYMTEEFCLLEYSTA